MYPKHALELIWTDPACSLDEDDGSPLNKKRASSAV